MTSQVEALIEQGEEALRTGDRLVARSAFERALENDSNGKALEGLAQVVYLEIDYAGAIALYERACGAYRRAGDATAAARAARTIAYLSAVYGDWAVMNGWVSRAQTLLSDTDEGSAEHAWVQLFLAFSESDLETHEKALRQAVAAGRRLGDADLESDALSVLGQFLVQTGRIEEGLVLQDEALAAVCAGEVKDFFVVEGIFCGMFTSCEQAHDVARAEQWIRSADDIVRSRGLTSLSAFCRAHYGGILAAAGRWEEAEAELTEAARIFQGGGAAVQANALVRLADLRVQQGRFEEAAVLLEGLDQHPDAPRTLAALHLAQGETELARDRLERALADPDATATTAGPLLALLVDVHLAEGHVEEAANAAERLAAVAEQQPSSYLKASAALAKGQVCVATGRDEARACLDAALTGFARAQMPMQLARARLELAHALTEDRPEVAVAEAKAALEAFERLEAARHVDVAAALLRSLGAPVRTGPKGHAALTKREAEILELLGHGLSNREIAERVYISTRTVEHHVSRVLTKLGLKRRAEATAYAARSPGLPQQGGA